MPCPISTCGITSVVLPALSMRMKALGAKTGSSWAWAAKGRWKPSSNPPPAAAPAFRKARRVGAVLKFPANCFADASDITTSSSRLRGTLDRFANADIGSATADVAGHGRVDVGVVGVGRAVQKRRRGHDLA